MSSISILRLAKYNFCVNSGIAISLQQGFHNVTLPLFMVLWIFSGCLVTFYKGNPISGALETALRRRAGVEGGMSTGRTMLNVPLFRFQFRDDSSIM